MSKSQSSTAGAPAKKEGLSMGGMGGIRKFNTPLASSAQFKEQYAKLKKDHSTGMYANQVKFNTPEEFDGRKVWANFIKPVRNQGSCGACWAFSASFALQTRLAISTGGKYNYNLAPSEMVLCNMGSEHEFELARAQIDKGEPYDFNLPGDRTMVRNLEEAAVAAVGCEGETMLGAWQYLYRFGVPEESCVTYENSKDDDIDISQYGHVL